MAIQFRISKPVEYVHASDPAVIVPDPAPSPWPAPDPDWLPADGQPAAATRFAVRPLSHDELQAAYAAQSDGFYAACYAGVVSVDGAPPPPLADLAAGWDRAIANLVAAITTLPMSGPASRSKAGPSKESTDGGSSGAAGTVAPT